MIMIYEKVRDFLEEHIKQFAVVSVVAGFLFPLALRYWEGGWTAEYAILATAGDWLGGTSAPLFSLAGFFMMYGAYKLQQDDLRLTRDEMKQTRKEFEKQNITLKRQEFETTFFHLIELHHQIVNGILYKTPEKSIYQGRQYFSLVYGEIVRDYKEYYDCLYGLPVRNEISPEQFDAECLNAILHKSFPAIEKIISHYFKNIFQILRILDKSILNKEEKMDFSKLLTAQLSNDELHLLYYHCVYNRDDTGFLELARRYGIFDMIDKKMLLNLEHLRELYTNE